MDKIYINDLEFIGYHGVFKEEKNLGQKFLISLELFTPLREAAKNDNLFKTIHYGVVSVDVEEIFFSKKYDLIESLAEDIAKKILKKYKLVEKIKVKIKKPWAPIGMIVKEVAVEIERKWNTVYLSLGSNIGNKKENLEKAIKKISELEDTDILNKAKIIETEPFGYIEQDKFLNTCIGLKTLFTAEELLEKILNIELEMGRERKIKWGPRIIDIDIIFFNKDILEEDNLVVPHPYMEYRNFVLEPLNEIAPNFVHPLLLKRVSTLKMDLENRESDKR